MMKKRGLSVFLLVPALAMVFLQGYCGGKSLPGEGGKGYPAFYNASLRVDGDARDWPSALFFNNSDANVIYAVANDSSHIYFCLQLLGAKEQMAMMHDGIAFWIDPKGKKNEACMIRLSFRPRGPEGKGGGGPEGFPSRGGGRQDVPSGGKIPPDRQAMMQKPKAHKLPGTLTISGFREGFNGTVATDTAGNGFMASMAYDSADVVIVEAMIPVKAFQADPGESKCLSLGFEIKSSQEGTGGNTGGEMRGERGHGNMRGGGMAEGASGEGGFGGGRMQEGGMGGEHGGGMRGGRQGGSPGGPPDRNDSQETKSHRICHRFSLAPVPDIP